MRQFSEAYLRRTREGMWEDSRAALADLDLPGRERVLDVGCGTGALSRVLAEESGATVVGLDADTDLLAVAAEHVPVVAGDALRLPVRDGAVDLVVCQALLVNLPDPGAAVAEFRRASTDLVAAVEPDNAAVDVASSVAEEERLERRARALYLDGVETDATLGGEGTRAAFEAAGLSDVRTRRYEHTRVVEPPYSEADLADARRKASGAGLSDDRATLRAGGASPAALDDLHSAWREMGRSVVEAMAEGTYRRTETVPFYVTVGRV